jgi:glutamate:GABA antiporter
VVSIVGSTSAWVSGSARILFVCGLDRYLPKGLGRIHSRYGSPHVALKVFGLLASCIIAMSFIGASVKDAYVTLLDLSAAIQMMSYLYLFSSLARVAFSRNFTRVYFGRGLLRVIAVGGLAMALAAFLTAFVPSRQVSSIWSFEAKMILTLTALLTVAAGLFFYYSRQKPSEAAARGQGVN